MSSLEEYKGVYPLSTGPRQRIFRLISLRQQSVAQYQVDKSATVMGRHGEGSTINYPLASIGQIGDRLNFANPYSSSLFAASGTREAVH